MNPPPLPATIHPRVPALRPSVVSRILSGLMVLSTGITTPFVAMIALTMTFVLFGAATSSSTNYTGGAGGIVMYISFVATPIVCLLHVLAASGGLSLPFVRWVWIGSCVYVLACWLAFFLGTAGGETDSSDTQRSWFPLIALLSLFSCVALAGTFSTWFGRSVSGSSGIAPTCGSGGRA